MKNKGEEIVLGIDYGDTRIGLAFGRKGLASPIKTVSGKNINEAINEIAQSAINHKITKIVVGLPLDLNGKETQQSLKTRQFSKLLKVRIKRPLEFVNEYGSSKDALEEGIEQGLSKKGRRVIDHFSAAVILKHYYGQ